MKQPQKESKPLSYAFEKLVEACCFPIKAKNIETFLEIWLKSAIWSTKAKNFIADKLSDD